MRKNTDFEYGELRKISRLSGYSYSHVCNVLCNKIRKNDSIVEIAKQVVASRMILTATVTPRKKTKAA
jgi:lambda repressor-like predicted transcriptional regulator